MYDGAELVASEEMVADTRGIYNVAEHLKRPVLHEGFHLLTVKRNF